jgi:hypothetical protein
MAAVDRGSIISPARTTLLSFQAIDFVEKFAAAAELKDDRFFVHRDDRRHISPIWIASSLRADIALGGGQVGPKTQGRRQ